MKLRYYSGANQDLSKSLARATGAFVMGLGILAAPASALGDSLWHDDFSKPMFADRRATRIGDIITIVVQENSSTSKDSLTKTAKKTGLDASISTFLYSPEASGLLTKNGKLPALKMQSQNDFSGGGSINNSEKIVTRIAVRVIDVMPNQNLLIEGTRQTTFSGETQDVVLRGSVRPDDVMANNTVFSYNIADAQIKFVSKGTVSDTQRKGWFSKVWDKISPF